MRTVLAVLMAVLWIAAVLVATGLCFLGQFSQAFLVLLAVGIPFAVLVMQGARRDARERKRKIDDANAFDPEPTISSAHFAVDAQLESAGCFDGHGPILGYSQESGRAIYAPQDAQDAHRMIWGATGSGKSTSALMVALLMEDGDGPA